jgi:hypothetical protein
MRLAAMLAVLAVPAAGPAQTIVNSPAPEGVAVTVYRDLNRGNEALNIEWLNGYALISERRHVRLPAGESELRFEGVAGGIIPQSAIVSGLPDGIIERNRDAYLLSPGTLLDRSLGRRVQLRRTSRTTGRVTEQDAVIRSGANGAVVLETPDGIEALRCTGQVETVVYPEVPAGLAAKPTLSVRTRSSAPLEATVTLSYLATGFDWQATYIVQLSDDGTRAGLFAWLTLASTDETSFRAAQASAVAGRLNRENVQVPPIESRPLHLECWPHVTTSDIPPAPPPPPPPPAAMMAPPPPPPMPERGGEDIVVTGSSTMKAEREELGDVKLYRIPEAVTVAANSQKQVAMIDQPAVRSAIVYRSRIPVRNSDFDQPATRTLVTRNRSAEGLGLPLPAGRVAVFARRNDRPILLGEGSLEDLAVGEEVEIPFGEAPGVHARLTNTAKDRFELLVTNDSPQSIHYEAELLTGDARLTAETRLGRRDGRPLWAVDIPANTSRTLSYRVAD